MNVLFVFSTDQVYSVRKPLWRRQDAQLGISYISALLKQNGHSTRLAVVSPTHRQASKRLLRERIDRFAPRLVCHTAVSTQHNFIEELAGAVRDHAPSVFQIIGGLHASLMPEKVIKGPFDALCIGEGEYPTIELVEQLDAGRVPSGIANLWVKRNGGVERNPTRPFLQDLDGLPFPDREMWHEWTTQPPVRPRVALLLGRGCPFKCAYCSNHALAKLAEGTYVRFRSPANIVAEIRDLRLRYPDIREMFLEVETIGVNTRWALELCAHLERLNAELDRPIAYTANLRVFPKCDFDGLFAAMRGANFSGVNIGLESGSERIRREVLRRRYSNDDVVRTVRQARRHGLRIYFYNLIGLPGETIEDFEKTVEMNRACRPDVHYTSIFYPYPGTDLYALCEKEGFLDERLANTRVERVSSVLDLPTFPRRDIEKRFARFDYAVYKGILPFHRIVFRTALAKINSFPRAMAVMRRVLWHPKVREWTMRLNR